MTQRGPNDRFTITLIEACKSDQRLYISREDLKRLAEAPHAVRSLQDAFGSQLEDPYLLDGEIHLPFALSDGLLDRPSITTLSVLRETEAQLVENAEGPALPLDVAVSHPHCIGPLRTIAHARERAALPVALKIGDVQERFSAVEPKHFSEKRLENDPIQRLRAVIEAICRSTPEGVVVQLTNGSRLHLPFAHYPLKSHEVLERIEQHDTVFIGMATRSKRNTFVALPGGELLTQQVLSI